jgi:hypothetical protein
MMLLSVWSLLSAGGRQLSRFTLGPMPRLLLASPLAWLAGLGAYIVVLQIFWGQSLGGDATFVLVWSAIGLFAAIILAYWPALSLLRWFLGGYRPMLAFIATAVLLGTIPTAMIVLLWGGRLHDLFSPEATLFYVMFAVVGAILGFAFSLHRGPNHRLQLTDCARE